VSKEFTASTVPRVWTGKVGWTTLLFATIRQLST